MAVEQNKVEGKSVPTRQVTGGSLLTKDVGGASAPVKLVVGKAIVPLQEVVIHE